MFLSLGGNLAGSVVPALATHLRQGNDAAAQRFRIGARWQHRSYGELWSLTRGVAAALIRHGAGRGSRIAIVAPTRADWSVVDLAAASIGAPLVPIYPTSAAVQIVDVVDRTRPAILIAERSRELPQLDGVRVLRIGDVDGDLGDLDPGRMELTVEALAAVDRITSRLDADDLFSISFSSGSTGHPKGCLLTHGNWVAMLEMAGERELGGEAPPAHRERAFIYLPLAHASARLQQLVTFSLGGELVYGSGGTGEILAQIAETSCTYVPAVPRLFESAYMRSGRDPDRLRETFGVGLRYALSGGAPIAPEMLEVYAASGILVVEGYGLTETTTAVAISAPHLRRSGSVGMPLRGMDVRIGDDGEIVVRGPNVFSGYLDDAVATAEAMEGDWFSTGDLGRIDADGYLYVTGRKKSLLVTSTGKKIAPEPMENLFRRRYPVDAVAIVGDDRPYLVAVVAVGGAVVDEAALLDAARTINARVSPPERVRALLVVAYRPSVDDGTLTPSGKLVRPVFLARLGPMVDDLYEGRKPSGATVLPIPATEA